MSIDLSEFHDIFFEECSEGLDVMESGLLVLDDKSDSEAINAIFRAAHSIKGGGASFGFMEISNFTHVMETLLDEMRDGRRVVEQCDVDILLRSVDVLRGMVDSAKDGDASDSEDAKAMLAELEGALSRNQAPEAVTNATEELTPNPEAASTEETACRCWKIEFEPGHDVLTEGNEPGRILRELDALGECKLEADTSQIPALAELDPERCYTRWTLELMTEAKREEIDDLFSWVIDSSRVDINSIDQEVAAEVAEQVTAQVTELGASSETAASAVAKADSTPANANAKSPSSKQAKDSTGSIRVATDKVDELINMVGELVITQSMLSEVGSRFSKGDKQALEHLLAGIGQLERNTRELQESVLQIRMLPVSFSFSRFPRLVRDLSGKLGKKIELKMTGEHTEVDKTVLEKINDPLVHLVRNSMDHGIEEPAVREANGKDATGTLELSAFHEGGDIIIQVIDDGAGLDRERILSKAVEKGLVGPDEEISDERVYNMIFAPGFSTAEQLSDVSGRGVGMDVVRRNVRDLGGNVSIASNPGAGSTVTIRLPLTLAILDGQLVRVGGETYIVSLVSIVETLLIRSECVSSIAGESEFYQLRDNYIPIIRVGELMGNGQVRTELTGGLLMVVECDGKHYGLLVDELLGQQQVVIKSLETNFRQIHGISGATILGDGTVSLIVDVPSLIQRHFEECGSKPRLTAVA